jgi:hypothetical protein
MQDGEKFFLGVIVSVQQFSVPGIKQFSKSDSSVSNLLEIEMKRSNLRKVITWNQL